MLGASVNGGEHRSTRQEPQNEGFYWPSEGFHCMWWPETSEGDT